MQNGTLFSHKMKGILPFVTIWVKLEDILLSEVSQTEKGRYCPSSLVYGELEYKKTFHRNREWIGGCQGQGGRI